MKKKFDWNHPVTRKDWAVASLVSVGIYVIIYGAWLIKLYWNRINLRKWVKSEEERIFKAS